MMLSDIPGRYSPPHQLPLLSNTTRSMPLLQPPGPFSAIFVSGKLNTKFTHTHKHKASHTSIVLPHCRAVDAPFLCSPTPLHHLQTTFVYFVIRSFVVSVRGGRVLMEMYCGCEEAAPGYIKRQQQQQTHNILTKEKKTDIRKAPHHSGLS